MAAPFTVRGRNEIGPGPFGLRVRRGRNLPLAMAGALVVVACALLFAGAWMRAGHRQPVLVVARGVSAGQVITPADLQVADISASGLVSLVPASEESVIVGRPAATSLPAGSLLTQGEVGSPPPVPGQVRLGTALKPGQYPPDLSPGQKVDVLGTPPSAAGASAQGDAVALPVGTAIVLAVSPQASAEGVVVVELQVSQDAMPQVAAAAATAQISLAAIAAGR